MPSVFKMALLTGLVIFFDEAKGHAQFQKSPYEFGISLGTVVYQGDLTPGYAGNYKSLKPSLGLSVSRLLTTHLGVGVHLTLGTISADESTYTDPQWRQDRSFSFSTRMTEVSALGVWNFVKTDEIHQPRFIPYLIVGAGLTFLHTRKDWTKVNALVYDEGSQVQAGLAIDTLKPASRVIAVLPIGAGLKYRVTPQVLFTSSVTYRLTTSDYIDGFKYSGNASKHDGYYGFSLGILYRFGQYKCPPVR